jgi:hypothetical protein
VDSFFSWCDAEAASVLDDILCLLPSWPEHRLIDLAPVEWTKTRERGDVVAMLGNNPFRRLTLLDPPR